MRHAVKPETHSRTIAAADVKQWFGRKAPSEAACSEIAERLTKMRWASDPQATFTPWVAEPDVDADRWWNFEAATSAAETLLAAFPRMLRHWDGLRWAPETSGGHPAIKAAQEALLAARPFIAAPFGPYERQDHRKRVRPADWHPPALAIKHILIQVLKRGGEELPISAATPPRRGLCTRRWRRWATKRLAVGIRRPRRTRSPPSCGAGKSALPNGLHRRDLVCVAYASPFMALKHSASSQTCGVCPCGFCDSRN